MAQQNENKCKITTKTLDNGEVEHKIYITEMLDYEYYMDAIDLVLEAQPNTHIVFVINSAGGYMDILDSFISAIDLSEAQSIVAMIVGEACSAAAILALACDDIITTYSSKMLIHSVSAGFSGKLDDIHNHLEISKIAQNRIAQRFYSNFLTEDEIADVLIGKELWLTSDEIQERWELVKEAREKELEQSKKDEEQEAEKLLVEVVKELGYDVVKRKGDATKSVD